MSQAAALEARAPRRGRRARRWSPATTSGAQLMVARPQRDWADLLRADAARSTPSPPSRARADLGEFAEKLLSEEQVAVVPGSAFGEARRGLHPLHLLHGARPARRGARAHGRFVAQIFAKSARFAEDEPYGTSRMTPTSRRDRLRDRIGLEVHAQLLTASKMFCRCSADYANAAPNTHCCPICMGFPGMLPVINERAVDYTIMTALALHCEIPEFSKFDRKNYFYPDLPKGYQISQYDMPAQPQRLPDHPASTARSSASASRASTWRRTPGATCERAERGEAYSLVDLNRAGVPLMEIVSEPDMRSAGGGAALRGEAAHDPASTSASTPGAWRRARCAATPTSRVRPRGQKEFGVKTEIKNMNSFRAVERALAYEARAPDRGAAGRAYHRAADARLARGQGRHGLAARQRRAPNDYRYFPEPDLPPLVVSREWVERDPRADARAARRQTRALRRARMASPPTTPSN